MRRAFAFAVVLFLLVGSAPPSQAQVAESVAVAVPGSFLSTYATPVVVVDVGGSLTFHNLDINLHDVVHHVQADGFGGPSEEPWCEGSGPCPVFWSPLIGIGSTPVLGLENLEAGRTYTFFCTIHTYMQGTLVALEGGQ